MLHEQNRVVVADGGPHEALGVGRIRWHDHLQPGDVEEPGFQALRMVGAHVALDAALDPHGQRHFQLAPGHVVELGRVVDELVHGQRDEVHEHDLHHRTQARQGRADGHAHDGAFADGRVHHPVRAQLLGDALGDSEGTSQRHVLAKDIDGSVLSHLGQQSRADRLKITQLRHIHLTRLPGSRSPRARARETKGRTRRLLPRAHARRFPPSRSRRRTRPVASSGPV